MNISHTACVLSPLRLIGCQRLPDVGLGNSELSRNPCWRDASLEGEANQLLRSCMLTGQIAELRSDVIDPLRSSPADGETFGWSERLSQLAKPNRFCRWVHAHYPV
jgi:hypothetical protein